MSFRISKGIYSDGRLESGDPPTLSNFFAGDSTLTLPIRQAREPVEPDEPPDELASPLLRTRRRRREDLWVDGGDDELDRCLLFRRGPGIGRTMVVVT
jgi:hypothetical protein